MKIVSFAFVAFLAFPAQAALPVNGKWMTQEKDSIIEIGTCGSTVCGRVHRVLKMMPNGQPPIDANNPDPALRTRAVQGIYIFSGFTDSGSHWNGQLYDPKSGKSYKSKLTRNPDGTLKVQGCIGPFCKSFKWTMVK